MRVRALPTLHDLPVSWDGRRVEWKGWETRPSTIGWGGRHGKPEACSGCRSTDHPATNMGLVYPLTGETVVTLREKTLKRTGRKISQEVEVPAHPIYWLHAFRCPSCHLDTVWDRRTDEWWDLDESDYGDEGSTDGALPGL